MYETKETNSNQKTTVQERMRHVSTSESSTHGAMFLEKVFCGLQLRATFADVNKIKLSE